MSTRKERHGAKRKIDYYLIDENGDPAPIKDGKSVDHVLVPSTASTSPTVALFSKKSEPTVIAALIRSDGDNCTLCRKPFQHRDLSFFGFTKHRRFVLVGACCHANLTEERMASVYLASNAPDPLPFAREWGNA